MQSLYAKCRWITPEGEICHRRALGTDGLCLRHLAAGRIRSLFVSSRNTEEERGETWWEIVAHSAVYAGTIMYFVYAFRHFGQAHFQRGRENDLHYGLIFSGLAMICFGKAVSLSRDSVLPRWLAIAPRFWSTVLWVGFAVGIYLGWTKALNSEGITAKVKMFCLMIMLLLPIGLAVRGIERRAGHASPALVTFGLVLIFFSGLCNPIIELFHRAGATFDYLPSMDSTLRSRSVAYHMQEAIGYLAASVDALMALWWTGQLTTPFGSRVGNLLRQSSTEGFFVTILRAYGLIIGVCLVIFGQANILRHALLPLLGGYPLSFLSMWGIPFGYVLIVILIHRISFKSSIASV